MFNSLLSANTSIIMYVVIGVVLVLMVVLTIVPQKKRQKQQQQMMSSLSVGTKIMTIGRMVGKITQVNSDNTLIVNVGTELSPTLVVIDKNAVGLVLENVASPVVTEAPAVESSEKDATVRVYDAVETPTDTADTFADIAPLEVEKAPAKKTSKKK